MATTGVDVLHRTNSAHTQVDPQDTHPQDHDETLHEPTPWTAEQVQAWRQRQPEFKLRYLFILQWSVLFGVSVLVMWVWGRDVAYSLAWGGVAQCVPSMLCGYLMRRHRATMQTMQGKPPHRWMLSQLAMWEMAKLLLSIALLALTPKLLSQVHWFAWLFGLVLMLKVQAWGYWRQMQNQVA